MNANELADRIEKSPYAEYKSAKEAATMLRQQQDLLDGYHKQSLNDSRAVSKLVGEMAEKEAEIDALKEVLIKVKELLEQSTEIDFDDMAHIAITSEDECDMRELIEKILSGEDDDEDR